MKQIAVISISVPLNMKTHWGSVVSRFDRKAKWIGPFGREGGRSRFSIYCELDMQKHEYKEFLTLLEERGLRNPYHTPASDYAYDAAYEKKIQAAHEKTVIWDLLRIDHRYTDKELRDSSLLSLIVTRAEIDPWGPNYGTTYDITRGCPTCGTGAMQSSPFYAPSSVFPKKGLVCDSGTEKFIATPLADAFRAASVTGLELRQVQSARQRMPLSWWQLIPEYIMPQMSPATKGIARGDDPLPCSHCRRDGYYHTIKEPEEIVYARSNIDADLDELPDVVQTWECFDVSWIDHKDFRRSRFAAPAILVKPKVFDILRKLKVRHVCFTPVRIE